MGKASPSNHVVVSNWLLWCRRTPVWNHTHKKNILYFDTISLELSRMEQLNLLREHNKDLVKQLKREKRAFEGLSGRYGAGAKRAEFQVLAGEEPSSAGATSAKPSVRFAGTCLIHWEGNGGVVCRAFKPVNHCLCIVWNHQRYCCDANASDLM